MRKLKLSPRLSAVADMAQGGKKFADIGTDHGYIAVSLALGGAESVTAADIRPGPLAAAERSAEEYGVSGVIRFVLADGLDFVGAEESDTIIIAGMGGETVCGILSRAPWTKNGARLILQPQTKIDETCVWLRDNGYALTDAAAAEDSGRLYAVIAAQGGESEGGETYFEEMLLKKRDPLLKRWTAYRMRVLSAAICGAEASSHPGETIDASAAVARLSKIMEELENDNDR